MKFASAVVFVLALAFVVQAQTSVAGKWQGATRNGNEVALELVVKDGALTGTFSRSGQPVPITEGKLVKNTIAFKAKINDQAEAFSGELAGDELKIWLERQGQESTVVMKRVKGK